MGMTPEYHARWIQLPLPSGESKEALHWTVSGMTESSARYLRYGFSQFTLSTTAGTYHIGRLSHGLFRVSTGSILRDSAALQGLTRIDPQRQLLCVGSVDDTAAPLSKAARLIAESERLVSSCTIIRNTWNPRYPGGGVTTGPFPSDSSRTLIASPPACSYLVGGRVHLASLLS